MQHGVLKQVGNLAPEARTLLLAVSGGPDSVALLRLLHGGAYAIEVAHVDHALRAESADDAAFVAALCEALAVPFHSERVEVATIAEKKGWNLEDAARRLRYAFLTRTAKRVGAGAIVTGHTLNDQAETVLMQLLRGAAFLRGMPARQGRVVRPLLGVSRQALLEHLAEIGQDFRTDVTNADLSKTRAWLRHEVLPLLWARYPNVLYTLAQLAEVQQAQQEHFDQLGGRIVQGDQVRVSHLLEEDVAVQRHAIAALLEHAGVPQAFEHIEAVRGRLEAEHPTRLSLPGDALARIAYGRLDIVRPVAEPADVKPVTEATHLPPEVDPSALQTFPDLVYRSRRSGDRIRLSGGTKKLSDVLIDLKVPKEERDKLRVLASGSEVLWAEGLATDVRVAKQTAQNPDVRWMRLALELARQGAEAGELPVGAVVVKHDAVIGGGHNTTETDHDPAAHAEMHAIRQAAGTLGDWRLEGCTLYVTLEPCPMCFGAMLQAHLPRLVYAAPNHREGSLGSVIDLREAPWKRRLEVKKGVLETQATRLLSEFFKRRRESEE